ncbi:MAG: hypothetical protein ACT4TC_22890 [Myxococcaceae bacterium]
MSRAHALTACLSLVSLVGAACNSQAAIHVVVEGSLQPNQHFDTLVLDVSRADDGTPIATESVSGEKLRLPYSFNLLAGSAAPNGTELKVSGKTLLGDVVIAQSSATGSLSRKAATITLTMDFAKTGESCASDAQCAPELHCDETDNRCANDRAQGQSCSRSAECTTGFCSDGVCCDKTCEGSCDACDSSTSLGVCVLRAAKAEGSPSCAPFTCTGAAATCGTSCVGDPDCAAGALCETGLCRGQKALGQSCTRAADCASNFCVDGVCCNNACAGACEACNITPGTCTAFAAGAIGSPSCAPYACTGTTGSCATTCGATQACAPGLTCVTSACMSKIASLRDDFQDNATDAAKWTKYTTGAAASSSEANGRLAITVTGCPNFAGYNSVARYDLTGSSAKVDIFSAGNQTVVTHEIRMRLNATATEALGMVIQNGQVISWIQNGGGYNNIDTEPYSAATARYLQLREAGGTVFWEISANNQQWTALASRTLAQIPFAITHFTLQIDDGCFNAEAGVTAGAPLTAGFEAFNP